MNFANRTPSANTSSPAATGAGDYARGAFHWSRCVHARLRDVLDHVHNKSAWLDEAQIEVETREVPKDGHPDDLARLSQRLSDDVHVPDLGDERAPLQIDRDAELEVLTAPEIQLEQVAATADVLVGIERLFQRQRR